MTFSSHTGEFAQIVDLDPADGITYDFLTTAVGLNAVAKNETQLLRAVTATSRANDSILPSEFQLAAIFNAAIARWAVSGLAIGSLERLRSVEFHFDDLGGDLLGLVRGNVIQIDRDAAGWGWFADDTACHRPEMHHLSSMRDPFFPYK